jgi:acyl-coenzyme A synthetase/AMP-(fatty) acid ligase/pimeloyl-ACP methyl ester carboxylesterase
MEGSRTVRAPDALGIERQWHLLDSWRDRSGTPRVTLLCVHGNPTWSFLWRRLVAEAPADVRVIAVDQLDMGYSERTGVDRRLAERVRDLGNLTDALALKGPVITVAHDWGGPVSLGWALDHRTQLAGIVLLNTAIHQPAESHAPSLIRLARSRPLLTLNTRLTPLFITSTTGLSRFARGSKPRLSTADADSYLAPYDEAERRAGVRQFVADIPLESDHPTAAELDRIAEGIRDLTEIPALLLWGPDDPVFSDIYLHDLEERLPHAVVHRYEGARHLVIEDAPELVGDLLSWVSAGPVLHEAVATSSGASSLNDALVARASEQTAALVTMGESGARRSISWQLLADRVAHVAAGFLARGIERGDRVSVLIPPGPDLICVVYALWRIGACAVVVDRGLGVRGMRRAIRGAAPRHVIGTREGLLLARTLRIRGTRISTSDLSRLSHTAEPTSVLAGADDEAVVVFTSGATGPAKGVIYRHHQVARTMRLLADHYQLTSDDSLVAAFAPWALLGPGLGITSVIPDMDVTRPATLTAVELAQAIDAARGTVVWAAPAALRNVVQTSDVLTIDQRTSLASVRLLLSAGAPVPMSLLERAAELFPQASVRTPYGMTEALPVAESDLPGIQHAGSGNGVFVGTPLPGVEIAIAPLDALGRPDDALVTRPGVTGEIAVRADHIREAYDRLWATTTRASRNPGWHRTGDVGHLDAKGALWVEGRLAHVVTTAEGPLTTIELEQRAIAAGVANAAGVGVGPVGAQQVILVIEAPGRTSLVGVEETERLRSACDYPFAAVLRIDRMPVDIRHNSKIDRAALGLWASDLLGGARG